MAQVITTILLDNNPKGLRLVTVGNWSGKAFVVPRGALKGFEERDESTQPGLYFLFGEQNGTPAVYIGQTETIRDRLRTHNKNREESEWDSALLFVGDLDSTTIKYLESIAIKAGKQAGRYTMSNATSPRPNSLSEAQKIIADEFFERVRLVAGHVGYSIFDESTKKSEAHIYYLEDVANKDASGLGALLESNEFVVYAGSKVRKSVSDSLKKYGQNVIQLRERLLAEKVLADDSAGSYVFKKDYVFTSPSIAATVVVGRAANGWTSWKDAQGKTLDENIRRQI